MDTISQNTPIRTQAVLDCPVCGHSGLVLHHSITDRTHGVAGQWDTMRCSHCQSGWLNPAPIPDDLAAAYVGAYYTHDAPPPCTLGSSKSAVFMRTAVLSFQKGYRHLQPATPLAPVAGALLTLIPQVRKRASFDVGDMVLPFRKGGRLLEIGCGAGYYLSQMKLLGWSVCGIEIDPVAAGVAAKIAGGNVHVGTIEDAPFEPGSFDAVVSHHVIEHVYNPKSFIATAGRLLAQGGVIAVQTPNFQSLGHKLFGVDWFSLDPPRHLCFFTPGSLAGLFEDSGMFSKVRAATLTQASSLAIRRCYAVRETGTFLGNIHPGGASRGAELLFRTAEALGNRVFHWGEEILCTGVKA